MKIVVAPDSFKGCMRSPDVCRVLGSAFAEALPGSEIIEIPLADGGEGTTDALVSALNGELVSLEVSGPLGARTTVRYAIAENGSLAVMEMAEAAGIEIVPNEALNPMKASTFGVGEMILDALERGVSQIIIGIGGSATIDGGAGMAEALGYEFLDEHGGVLSMNGASIADVAEIRKPSAERSARIAGVEFLVATDVDNPLTGPNGAAVVYGPQKGASGEMIPLLDSGLRNLMNTCLKAGLVDSETPGDGAAGGLGAGLRAFCGAELAPGAELICDAVGLDRHLDCADLLVTGEGRTDSQTILSGKLCSVVAGRAREKGIRTLLISGALELEDDSSTLFDYAFSSSLGQTSLERLLYDAERNLRTTALNIAKLIALRV